MESESPYHEIPILVAEYNPEPVGFTVTILVILVHVRMRHSIEIVNPVPNALWYSPHSPNTSLPPENFTAIEELQNLGQVFPVPLQITHQVVAPS